MSELERLRAGAKRAVAILALPVLGWSVSTTAAWAEPNDRTYEGDWYIADNTNNNTGEREVYAFQTFIEKGNPNFVTLTIRCEVDRPIFMINWADVTLPDQAVITIGPVPHADAEPEERRYVFEKGKDSYRREIAASAETSAQIVAAIGTAPYATITAATSYGSRTVGMKVAGTPGAWSRVSRHCPAPIMPLPPL